MGSAQPYTRFPTLLSILPCQYLLQPQGVQHWHLQAALLAEKAFGPQSGPVQPHLPTHSGWAKSCAAVPTAEPAKSFRTPANDFVLE